MGNKLTAAHPEYGLDQAPAHYIEPYSAVAGKPNVEFRPRKVAWKRLRTQRWTADVQRRNLSGMVAAMDEAAGNVTGHLKDNKLWANSLFIFSTVSADGGTPIRK